MVMMWGFMSSDVGLRGTVFWDFIRTAIVSFLVRSLCTSLNAMCILEGDGRRIGAWSRDECVFMMIIITTITITIP